MKKILNILPILIYVCLLLIIKLWWMNYYGTPKAGDIGFLFVLPYVLGGAFVLCLVLGLIVGYISKNRDIKKFIFYLLLLLIIVEIIHSLGYVYEFMDTEGIVILIESIIGFSIGSLIMLRRNKKEDEKNGCCI